MQTIEKAVPLGTDPGMPLAKRSGALGSIAKSVDEFPLTGRAQIACEMVQKAISHAREEERILQARSARWELKKAVEKLLPGSRTSRCSRSRLVIRKAGNEGLMGESSDVRIYQSLENESTFYGGLETCSSVWCCPICAAKISERRRQELIAMRDVWKSKGGTFRFLTLTFPHGSYDVLKELLSNFSKARKKLFSSRQWRAWSKNISLVHKIYALEVTHGMENGWHIHLHCVLFIMPGKEFDESRSQDLLPAWQRACFSSGLAKPNSHGIDIRNGDAATNYITKWGLDQELTKQHVKRGREGHSTPFDLIRRYADGDNKAGTLFKEFACAFKGKRQIVLSTGLRKALGLGVEKTDQEIAQENIDKALCIASLTPAQWKNVLRYEFRFALLEEARLRGSQGVREILEILQQASLTPDP